MRCKVVLFDMFSNLQVYTPIIVFILLATIYFAIILYFQKKILAFLFLVNCIPVCKISLLFPHFSHRFTGFFHFSSSSVLLFYFLLFCTYVMSPQNSSLVSTVQGVLYI